MYATQMWEEEDVAALSSSRRIPALHRKKAPLHVSPAAAAATAASAASAPGEGRPGVKARSLARAQEKH